MASAQAAEGAAGADTAATAAGGAAAAAGRDGGGSGGGGAGADDADTSTPRVLSIQSWVVHGYVGNRCAVFALQAHGIEVDAINTVNLSNHTGYASWRGDVLDGEQLWALFEGLRANGLAAAYSHVLSGYVRSAGCLERIAEVVATLKRDNPRLVYVCDPVMGDNGKLYVPAENVAIFRDKIVPLADMLFPNQTEAELLTDVRIVDRRTALTAIDKLHERGVRVVIVTSWHASDDAYVRLIGSVRGDGDGGGDDGRAAAAARFALRVDKRDGAFTGTGDLFSALMLAFTARRGDARCSVQHACELTVSALQAVLARTLAAAPATGEQALATPELRLVQSRADVCEPRVTCSAEPLSLEPA